MYTPQLLVVSDHENYLDLFYMGHVAYPSPLFVLTTDY